MALHGNREIIWLRSTGKTKDGKPTGTFKTCTKNKKGEKKEKLEIKCYDPRAWNPEAEEEDKGKGKGGKGGKKGKGKRGAHVIFKEGKALK